METRLEVIGAPINDLVAMVDGHVQLQIDLALGKKGFVTSGWQGRM
ncbi:MAG: hypothetical protein ACYDAN_07270 [Candidatus Limnocylindrales bacterium]